MSFADDVADDLKEILGGEFNERDKHPVKLTVGSLVFPEVDGLFDEVSFLQIVEGKMPQQTNRIQIGIFIQDIDDGLGRKLKESDQAEVTIGTIEFIVAHIGRDGTGYALLKLITDE